MSFTHLLSLIIHHEPHLSLISTTHKYVFFLQSSFLYYYCGSDLIRFIIEISLYYKALGFHVIIFQ